MDLAPKVMAGTRRVETDDEGRALIDWVSDASWIVAESPSGRSWPAYIEAGEDRPVTLVLRPFQRLRVESNRALLPDERLAATLVPVANIPGREVALVVSGDASGVIDIPRVPAGAHDLFIDVQHKSSLAVTIHRTLIEVDPMRPSEVSFSLKQASGRLDVTLEGPGGTAAPPTNIIALPGRHQPPTSLEISEINPLIRRATAHGPTVFADRTDEQVIHMRGLVPGIHTVCVVPIWHNRNDPRVLLRLLGGTDEVSVQCQTTRVRSDDASHLHIRLENGPPTRARRSGEPKSGQQGRDPPHRDRRPIRPVAGGTRQPRPA